jgi:hypothetical protein
MDQPTQELHIGTLRDLAIAKRDRSSGKAGRVVVSAAAQHGTTSARLGSPADPRSAGRSRGVEAQSVDEDRDHSLALVDVRLSDRST